MPRTLAPALIGFAGALAIAALNGCASSRVVLVGRPRPAISPDQVQLYLQPPESPYEQIASLTASSSRSLAFSAPDKIEKVVERLKKEAAKLGANGLLLHGVGDQAGASVGAGISTETNSGHSPYGIGFGAWAFFGQKSGEADAIYLEPK
jgi:hypothetical protein